MKKTQILLVATLLIFVSSVFAQKKEAKNDAVVMYIARHGKTILNTMDRVQGWADAPLTPPGIEVAEFLGVGLNGIPFKAAYSSDLGRARSASNS